MDLYASEIMKGLSANGQHRDKPYLTGGDRSYLVGTQDGDFPDLGSHVKGEMGGLWMYSVKLVDGFWLKLTDAESGSETWLKQASNFMNFPYGNRFIYGQVLGGIAVERFQFCPQGKESLVIQYTLRNNSPMMRKLDLNFVVKTDLSPVWFSKENNILDAADSISWNSNSMGFEAKDMNNPWFATWGALLPVITHSEPTNLPIKTSGAGKAASTVYQVNIKPHDRVVVTFVITGSDKNIETARALYKDVLKNHDELLKEKKLHYLAVINRARLDIPDKKLQEVYTWTKLNTEWLVCDLPGTGRFLTAGAVEYPWLFGCDNFYALQGVVASGDFKLAESTLRAIKNVSERVNGNGRIIHEMSSNGFVGNKGNSQETAQFGIAVWKVFQWTGDFQFLKEMYPSVKKGLLWLVTNQDQNHNLFPEGYGIMEVKGLNAELIDVAVYTQQAFEDASKMADLINDVDAAKEYSKNADILKRKINELFWDSAKNSYCDFYASREQAVQTVRGCLEQLESEVSSENRPNDFSSKKKFYDSLLVRFSKFPRGTQKGWITNNNWVISTPMETGIAPYDRAVQLLDQVRTENCGLYGPYLSAVERQSMMTIATGVQAMAECAYGRVDKALWYIDKIVQAFGKVLPGSISEMMPDYGCPVQAWTIYGVVTPLISKFIGISPDAYNRRIAIAPQLPTGWGHIDISHLAVGDNIISISVQKKTKWTEYRLTATRGDWTYMLKINGQNGKRYLLNGRLVNAHSDEIQLTGKENRILALL